MLKDMMLTASLICCLASLADAIQLEGSKGGASTIDWELTEQEYT